jgi:hypothetical protein
MMIVFGARRFMHSPHVKSWFLVSSIGVLILCSVAAFWFRSIPERDAEPAMAMGWFVDVTDAVGLDFVHDAGPVDGCYFLPQVTGSGAAVFDFDRDGRLDLYLLTNGGPAAQSTNRLYRNMPDGTFKDVTEGSGLGITGYSMGVAIGDVNNDGLPDVLVTQYGGIKLFLNRGGGKFEDVTVAAGLVHPGWGTSAAFLDYDRDGWLDLVVVNYVDFDPSWICQGDGGRRDYCKPEVFSGTATRLFHNQGMNGANLHAAPVSFQDVTLASGLGHVPGPGLGVFCADFNGDAWPDIFVANDGAPNHLWINQHNGTFTEEAVPRGVAYNGLGLAQAGMGVACGDVGGNGLLDVFVTHLQGETHTLWKQGPRGMFLDRTGACGLARPAWQGTGFGTVFADFNNDGHLDLALVNGRVARRHEPVAAGRGPHWDWYVDRNQLFANDGDGRFRDVSVNNAGFCSRYNIGRGLACVDFNGDGKVDLLVTSLGDRARLYRNTSSGAGHWLRVRTRLRNALAPNDALKDRDAIGAEVTVEAGNRRWVRIVTAGDSYLCNSEANLHFGLGAHDRVDRITVCWPDGSRERFPPVAADQLIDVRQGKGEPVS